MKNSSVPHSGRSIEIFHDIETMPMILDFENSNEM